MDSFLDRIEIEPGNGFPVVRNLWDFFSSKGSKVVFFSLGESQSPNVELHFSENLGCKIHIFDPRPEGASNWEDVCNVLKNRKLLETTTSFAKSALKRWVLPTNIVYHPWIPHFQQGDENLKTTVESICSQIGENRIDILKVNITDQTVASLYAMLHYGYRPGLLLVSWQTSPDASTETTLLAGHIQTTGYALMYREKNNYLYFFNDKCAYELCSWENYVVENPLVSKIFQLANEEKTSAPK